MYSFFSAVFLALVLCFDSALVSRVMYASKTKKNNRRTTDLDGVLLHYLIFYTFAKIVQSESFMTTKQF